MDHLERENAVSGGRTAYCAGTERGLMVAAKRRGACWPQGADVLWGAPCSTKGGFTLMAIATGSRSRSIARRLMLVSALVVAATSAFMGAASAQTPFQADVSSTSTLPEG